MSNNAIILRGLGSNFKSSISNILASEFPNYTIVESFVRTVIDVASNFGYDNFENKFEHNLFNKITFLNLMPINKESNLIIEKLIFEQFILTQVQGITFPNEAQLLKLIILGEKQFKERFDNVTEVILSMRDENFLQHIFETDNLRKTSWLDVDCYFKYQSKLERLLSSINPNIKIFKITDANKLIKEDFRSVINFIME